MAPASQARHPKAVVFDVGQTLLEVKPSVGHVYAEAAVRHGVEAAPDELEQAFRRLWAERRSSFPDDRGYGTSEAEERAWWREIVHAVFTETGHRDRFGDAFEDYFDHVFALFETPRVWRVFEDVVPALDELDRLGLRKAVISNWDQRLHVLLDRLGLKRRFEFVLTSAEVGHRKPHPIIFQAAIDRLGLPPADILYIGDSKTDDVAGAQAVGMRALLLDRHRAESTPTVLASLTHLSSWLARELR